MSKNTYPTLYPTPIREMGLSIVSRHAIKKRNKDDFYLKISAVQEYKKNPYPHTVPHKKNGIQP